MQCKIEFAVCVCVCSCSRTLRQKLQVSGLSLISFKLMRVHLNSEAINDLTRIEQLLTSANV